MVRQYRRGLELAARDRLDYHWFSVKAVARAVHLAFPLAHVAHDSINFPRRFCFSASHRLVVDESGCTTRSMVGPVSRPARACANVDGARQA